MAWYTKWFDQGVSLIGALVRCTESLGLGWSLISTSRWTQLQSSLQASLYKSSRAAVNSFSPTNNQNAETAKNAPCSTFVKFLEEIEKSASSAPNQIDKQPNRINKIEIIVPQWFSTGACRSSGRCTGLFTNVCTVSFLFIEGLR